MSFILLEKKKMGEVGVVEREKGREAVAATAGESEKERR